MTDLTKSRSRFQREMMHSINIKRIESIEIWESRRVEHNSLIKESWVQGLEEAHSKNGAFLDSK